MKTVILLYNLITNVLYSVLRKILKKKNKVVFLSRQSSKPSEDFLAIEERLNGIKTKKICIRDNSNLSSMIKLLITSFYSLFHIATAKVCVLDSYWPAVSVLKHKDFKAIQIWHDIGKIKKSGYQTLGKASGRNENASKLLGMHKNYDYVIGGSKYFNKYYCESFGIDESIIRNYGLPRVDRLRNNKNKSRELFFSKYPKLKDKTIVLYAPTFRKGYDYDFTNVAKHLSSDKYQLIVKVHPNSEFPNEKQKYLTCDDLSTEVVLAASDYIITDYSSIALEAAVIDVKIYYLIDDYEEYTKHNGLNLKIQDEYPELCFKDIPELRKVLEEKEYKEELFISYKNKFISDDLRNSADKISNLIIELVNEK